MAELARRLGKRVVTHGYKSNITIAANLAFLSRHWMGEPCEYSTSQPPLRWHLTRESFPIGPDGRIVVPEAPGLGVSLDPGTVAKYRVACPLRGGVGGKRRRNELPASGRRRPG